MNNATITPILRPASIDEVSQIVREHPRLHVIGATTKSALAGCHSQVPKCVITGLSGIVEHDPAEFLITALAGTPVGELQTALAAHGQYLPFDPPFVSKGATIGGTVAAGLSGAGRLRFGGLRDFIVGIRIIDGLGNVSTGGGRVVKNAAGYDLPKLMVGSGGFLGAIVEVTLKVFPRPTHSRTLHLQTDSLVAGLEVQSILSRMAIDIAAMDLTPEGSLWLRIEGAEPALDPTTNRIEQTIRQREHRASVAIVDNAAAVWQPLADGSFGANDDRLVRVPISPTRIALFDTGLGELTVRRRYSVAGNVTWIAWPAARPLQQLDETLRHHELGGTVLIGEAVKPRIGIRPSAIMSQRVKQAIDPENRFVGSF